MSSNRRPGWRCSASSIRRACGCGCGPGLALVASRWPVATIWQAHRRDDEDRFAAVRAAFAAQTQETALVARDGWRAQVEAIDAPTAAFTAALQRGDAWPTHWRRLETHWHSTGGFKVH